MRFCVWFLYIYIYIYIYAYIHIYRYIHMFIFHLKKLPLTRQNYGIFHDFSVWGFGCLRQPQRLHALSPCLALHGLPFVSESRLSYGIFQNLCVFNTNVNKNTDDPHEVRIQVLPAACAGDQACALVERPVFPCCRPTSPGRNPPEIQT